MPPGSEAIAKQAEPIMNSTPIRRASPLAAPRRQHGG